MYDVRTTAYGVRKVRWVMGHGEGQERRRLGASPYVAGVEAIKCARRIEPESRPCLEGALRRAGEQSMERRSEQPMMGRCFLGSMMSSVDGRNRKSRRDKAWLFALLQTKQAMGGDRE
jgi:hypothetical protein